MRTRSLALLLALVGSPLLGCQQGVDPIGAPDVSGNFGAGWKEDSSAEATFLYFEFDGEVVTSSEPNRSNMQELFLYTIGQLNGENSVGRLDNIQLTDVQSTELEGGGYRSTYHAKLLVAWGMRDNVPQTYELILPKNATAEGLDAFTARYKDGCTDLFAHDVDVDSMWYYYRPRQSGCQLAADDVFRSTATVSRATNIETDGKYPEYAMVWSDDVLRVVSIFGKYEEGATDNGDPGIGSFRSFIERVTEDLRAYGTATNREVTISMSPETLPERTADVTDVTVTADLGDGTSVEVVTLLVEGVRVATPAFYERYAQLSPTADFIGYTGHSGLGANIRALAARGTWVEGQHVVVMMNGCDTYAYVDGALARAHRDANPNVPEGVDAGTKYLDLVMNAMPSPARTGYVPPFRIYQGLLRRENPTTYQQIFRQIDESQVVLVSGEQDNEDPVR